MITAVELFAGIGGFRVGLERAGIEVVWANDIDSKCCSIYEAHFGDGSIVCGDISAVKSSVPNHDILTAGFPCQPFSAAGKKLGVRDHVRGTLFSEIVDILEAVQPKCFILENVKRLLTMERGQHFRTILLALTGAGYFVEWRLLNATDFGLAQNRERVFIVGRKNGGSLSLCPPTSFGEEHSILFLPGDLGAGHSLLPFSALSDLLVPIDHRRRFGVAGIASAEKAYSFNPPSFPLRHPRKLLRDILEEDPDLRFDFTDVTNGWLKRNTAVNSFIHGVEILSNQEGGRRMGYTIFGIGGVAPTLTATPSRHYERYRIGDRYRRLTNVEYARLQGFDDKWCSSASVYDQYALYGNAVPPSMVAWIATRLIERCRPTSKGRSNAGHKVAAASSRS